MILKHLLLTLHQILLNKLIFNNYFNILANKGKTSMEKALILCKYLKNDIYYIY